MVEEEEEGKKQGLEFMWVRIEMGKMKKKRVCKSVSKYN